MKTRIFMIAFMLMCVNVFSQSYTEMRPSWTKYTPSVPTGANYFVNWGVGEGRSETEAINAAWADALQKSLHELGVVGITQQDINVVANRGINAVVKFNRMKRRVIASTEPVYVDSQRMKVYILIQVQRNVNGVDDFYSLDVTRYRDKGFDKTMKDYNAQLTGHYPFSARVFVPGMAQLHKGSTEKGLFFIMGEIACVGGLVTSECLRASYDSKIKSTQNVDQMKSYINSRDNCENFRNGFIVGAAALYVWNVIDGIVAKGKKRGITMGDATLRFAPYVAPRNSGVAFALNF